MTEILPVPEGGKTLIFCVLLLGFMGCGLVSFLFYFGTSETLALAGSVHHLPLGKEVCSA